MILDEESEVSSADVIEQLDELTKDMDCEVTTDTSASDMTSLMGSGLTINVKGNNLDKLQELAGEVQKTVENTEGTVDVDDGLANTTPSFTISVDKEKAAEIWHDRCTGIPACLWGDDIVNLRNNDLYRCK